VLVTKNAANVGIDKSQIALQVQFDWPRDLLTYFQERGHGLRQPGVRSTCVLYADLSSYVFLLCQLICGSEHTNITVESQSGECEGFNSANSPRRPTARPANTSHKDFALRPTAQKRLQDCCIEELHKVIRFFCLDLGCQHERGEIYLSSDSLDSITSIARCSSCPICNQRYHTDFLPVYKSGVVSFLELLTLTTKLPFVIDGKIQVSLFLMTSAYWKEIIFDKASTSITQTNVDSLFLSLAVAGILEIQNSLHSQDGIRWVLGRQAPTIPLTDTDVLLINITFGVAKYTLDNYWVGINLHPATRIQVCTPAIPAP
jgi:hypothetical protein